LDNLGRRGGGFGFGLELFEGLEGTVVGAAGGINAPLELGEDARVAGAGLSEGQGFGGVGELLVYVSNLIPLGVQPIVLSSKGTGCDSPVPERRADSLGPGTLPDAVGRADWNAELPADAGSGFGGLGTPREG
jgi:hypothetical protein